MKFFVMILLSISLCFGLTARDILGDTKILNLQDKGYTNEQIRIMAKEELPRYLKKQKYNVEKEKAYIDIENMKVNLLSERGSNFLNVSISFAVGSNKDKEYLENRISIIKDILIKILASHVFEEVSTMKGKQRIKEKIISEINSTLKQNIVLNTYFTKFFITSLTADDIINRIRSIEDRCFGN